MKNQRIAVAGDTITIPENTRVIIDDGIILFEPTTPKERKYKINEWYSCSHTILLTTEALANNNEFYCSGFELDKQKWVWFENRCCDVSRLDNADMKEVERLLIGEAEKRGFDPKNISVCSDQHGSGFHVWFKSVDKLFNSDTGHWAEIIPENKPLYTNHYGREYFGGENYHYVFDGLGVGESNLLFDKDNFHESGKLKVPFVGSKRECHQYIVDNWDELNENK